MAYTTESARRQLLDQLAEVVARLAAALSELAEAYEEVDERTGDTLEGRLFRPVQGAYARARRTHTEFAERHGLPAARFADTTSVMHAADPRLHLERTIEAVEGADHELAEMQDSMLPVEVGDRQLRDGLTETRELISAVPGEARQLLRVLGR